MRHQKIRHAVIFDWVQQPMLAHLIVLACMCTKKQLAAGVQLFLCQVHQRMLLTMLQLVYEVLHEHPIERSRLTMLVRT
jgi:hypothetical protein